MSCIAACLFSYGKKVLSRLLLCACVLAGVSARAENSTNATAGVHARAHAPLPHEVTSFGAALLDGHAYFFGGHNGAAHKYSRETTLGTLWRLPLREGGQWANLGEGTAAQGTSLVAWKDALISVGGLAPQNKAGEPEELLSLDNVLLWRPSEARWQKLPSLPKARSSHDSVVLGDRLYIGGGWRMQGREGSARWADQLLVLDLSAQEPVWKSVPQPFKRRALAVAVAGGKIYFLGGMDAQSNPSQAVDVFDPAAGTWSQGPELPKGTMNGFGCAAAELDGRLYVSLFSGVVCRLSADGKSWEELGKLTQGRFFHRLIPHEGKLLVLGGTSRKERIKEIEVFTPAKAQSQTRANWPGFRGDGRSLTSAQDLPLRWSGQEGVRWRSELPGVGQSSPVIWGDTVYLTSVAGLRKEELVLTAHDLATGAERWRFTTQSSQPEEDTEMRSKAAPTPVAASEGVYVLFESGDVIALTHAGKPRWQRSLTKEFGPISGNHGAGASPVLTQEALVVLLDQKTPSCLVALGRDQGEVRWQVSREGRVSWSSPLVLNQKGKELVVVSAGGDVRAYAASTGEEMWKVEGLQRNLTPSPTADIGWLLVGSSQKGSNVALKLADGAPPEISWRAEEATSGFGSPLIHQGRAYFVSSIGVLYCHEVQTGRKLFEGRLSDGCWASPVGAGGHVYFFGSKGVTLVLQAADTFHPVATNTLPTDKQVHGVAAVDGAWLIRSNRQLFCIGTPRLAGH